MYMILRYSDIDPQLQRPAVAIVVVAVAVASPAYETTSPSCRRRI